MKDRNELKVLLGAVSILLLWWIVPRLLRLTGRALRVLWRLTGTLRDTSQARDNRARPRADRS